MAAKNKLCLRGSRQIRMRDIQPKLAHFPEISRARIINGFSQAHVRADVNINAVAFI